MGDDTRTLNLLRRIMAKQGVTSAITESVRDDFEKQTGRDLGEVVEVRPDLPVEKPKDWDQMVLACVRYNPLEPPILPDNIIADCAWGCGHKVQYRPHHPEWLTTVCLECLAERPVKDHG